MTYQYIVIFLIPLILALVLTPFVIRLAKLVGAIDYPNERKVHKYPIPRFGGIAIYMSFIISLYIFSYIDAVNIYITKKTVLMLLGSATIVLLLGIWDDIKELKPGKKFIWQCIAATIVYLAGFKISSVTSFSGDLLYLGILDYPITLLWIVGITNAFNLIDGLDGLASGVATIAGITIFSISIVKDDIVSAILVLAFVGSLVGFMRYNFYNAKIFLGDSGSLLIGFTLAIFSILSKTKSSTAFSVIFPLLVLGLPIMDTMLSMVRRFMSSLKPNKSYPIRKLGLKSIFYPDKKHIHHQLMNFGFSQRKVVIILYIVSVIFGIGAFTITMVNTVIAVPILMGIAVIIFIGITQLGYKEMAILRNGTFLPIFERPLVKNTSFQFLLDFFSIMFAFISSIYLSTFLGTQQDFEKYSSFLNYIIISSVQILILSTGGIYKLTLKQFALGDVLKIVKLVIISVFASWFLFSIIYQSPFYFPVTMYILDFYILSTLIIGGRLLFKILHYYANMNKHDGKINVLIYGLPHPSGVNILECFLTNGNLDYKPIGILDDDPYLEGKRINGYRILGSHWNLHEILNNSVVHEILIFPNNVNSEVLERIVKISSKHNIRVKRINTIVEDVVIDKTKVKLFKNIKQIQEKYIQK